MNDKLKQMSFELEAIRESLIAQNNERWVKGYTAKDVEEHHIERYKFAINNVKGSVLDIAAGCGYGSLLLTNNESVHKVTSVDIDSDSVSYGENKYPHSRVVRIIEDALVFSNNEVYDTIVCFETIEHVDNPEKLILNFTQLLKENGCLLISTPLVKKTDLSPKNQFHKIEWSAEDFIKLFDEQFIIDGYFIQNPVSIRKNSIITKFRYLIGRIFAKLFFLKIEELQTSIKKSGIYSINDLRGEVIGGYQLVKLRKRR